eukprot:8241035-Alexandrium_andersonii.AAC.1
MANKRRPRGWKPTSRRPLPPPPLQRPPGRRANASSRTDARTCGSDAQACARGGANGPCAGSAAHRCARRPRPGPY